MTQIFLLAGTTSWTVPADWNNSANTIEAVGSGGGDPTFNQYGGGGGAYASISNLTLTPGATISVQIGAGNGVSLTQFMNSGTLVADYGRNTSSGTPGAGGLASNSVGSIKFSGGNGNGPSGGGGGAAGPLGNGGNGGTWYSITSINGGGGGGANNGTDGSAASATQGGAGGNPGSGGTGGIGATALVSATTGINGGGGGGGSIALPNGGDGSPDTTWITKGLGGGGGGGESAAGANYGGGAGSYSGSAPGGDGLIVITYTSIIRSDFPVSSESVIANKKDLFILNESLSAQRNDPQIKQEIIHINKIDFLFPFEITSKQVVADSVILSDFLLSGRSDISIEHESLASQKSSLLPLEWLGRPKRDTPVINESVCFSLSDGIVIAEIVFSAANNSFLSQEFIAPIFSNALARQEYYSKFKNDISLIQEWVTGTLKYDAKTLLESTAIKIANSLLRLDNLSLQSDFFAQTTLINSPSSEFGYLLSQYGMIEYGALGSISYNIPIGTKPFDAPLAVYSNRIIEQEMQAKSVFHAASDLEYYETIKSDLRILFECVESVLANQNSPFEELKKSETSDRSLPHEFNISAKNDNRFSSEILASQSDFLAQTTLINSPSSEYGYTLSQYGLIEYGSTGIVSYKLTTGSKPFDALENIVKNILLPTETLSLARRDMAVIFEVLSNALNNFTNNNIPFEIIATQSDFLQQNVLINSPSSEYGYTLSQYGLIEYGSTGIVSYKLTTGSKPFEIISEIIKNNSILEEYASKIRRDFFLNSEWELRFIPATSGRRVFNVQKMAKIFNASL